MAQRVKQQAVVVAAVLHRGQPNLPQIARADSPPRFFPCVREHRKQKRSEQAENGENS